MSNHRPLDHQSDLLASTGVKQNWGGPSAGAPGPNPDTASHRVLQPYPNAGALTDLPVGKIVCVVAPHSAHRILLDLAAMLACRGPLSVLDGGNRFDAYRLARSLRQRTVTITPLLDRISLARAFTCYQMEALLAAATLPALPTLVLDLLATFYDESVSLAERCWLLERCMGHLRTLSQRAPVAVSAYPASPDQPERLELLGILFEAADQVWEMDLPAPPVEPLRLF